MAQLVKYLVSARFLIVSLVLILNSFTIALAYSSHKEYYQVNVPRAHTDCRDYPCNYVCHWHWWYWWWWWGSSCSYRSTCWRCDTRYVSVQVTRSRCASQWKGPNCDIPICSPACTNDGAICEAVGASHQCRCVTTQGGTCSAVPCINGKSCYPGTCENEVCKCPPEFSGDNCEQFKQTPEVSECRVQLLSGSPETEVAMANCAVEGAEPDVTWVRTDQFTRILSNWEPTYSNQYKPVLPTATRHIEDAKFGVTYSRATATLNVSTTAQEEPNPREVRCKNDYKDPRENIKCSGQEIKWSEFGRGPLPDNSTIKVAISAKLGGFKKPKNSAEERITGDNETTRLVLFKIDSTPPWHCRQASNCKEPAISLKSDAVKDPVIEGNFTNWYDWTSGIDRYCFDVYQLLKANDVLEPSQQRTDTFCRSGVNSFQYTIPSPGVFSLLLKVYDKANNTATARKIVLFHKQIEDTNEGVTTTGEPLKVNKVTVESGYGWITTYLGMSNDGKSRLILNWKGRYINRKHLSEGWLLRTRAIDGIIDDDLLDTDERRTIHEVKHTNGTVGYKLAFKVDQQGGGDSHIRDIKESNESNSDREVQPLAWGLFDHTAQEATLVMPKLTSNDTISIWIQAFDVVGYSYNDSIQIGMDNSPPKIDKAVLREDPTELYTSSIAVKAEDLECGIREVRYWIYTKLAGNITSGTVPATRLKSDGNRRKRALRVCITRENPDCYCIRGGDCFSRTIVVEIENCQIDQHYRADQKMEMDYVVVNQADQSERAPGPLHILFANGAPACRAELWEHSWPRVIVVNVCVVVGVALIIPAVVCFVKYVKKRKKIKDGSRQTKERRMSNSDFVYEDVGYDSIGFPLEEIAKGNERSKTRDSGQYNYLDGSRQTKERRMSNSDYVYEDIGYDSIGFPLEEIAEGNERSKTRDSGQYNYLGYDSIDRVPEEIGNSAVTHSSGVDERNLSPLDTPQRKAIGRERPTLDKDITSEGIGYLKPLEVLNTVEGSIQPQITGSKSVRSESKNILKLNEQSESAVLNREEDNGKLDINPKEVEFHSDLVSTELNPYVDMTSNEVNPYLDLVSTEVNPYLDLVSTEANPYLDLVSTEVNPYLDLVSTEVNPYLHPVSPVSTEMNQYFDLTSKEVNPYLDLVSPEVNPYLDPVSAEVNLNSDSVSSEVNPHMGLVSKEVNPYLGPVSTAVNKNMNQHAKEGKQEMHLIMKDVSQ